MNPEVIRAFVDAYVKKATADGWSAFGTDDTIAASIFNELVATGDQLPARVFHLLLGLLCTLELRNHQLRRQSTVH
jgi:hypothetical protein